MDPWTENSIVVSPEQEEMASKARSPGGAAVHTCRLQQPRMWRWTQQQRLRRGTVRKVVQALAPSREPEGTAMRPGRLKRAGTAWLPPTSNNGAFDSSFWLSWRT